jgi:FkbM family methyltransferase
MKKIIFDFGANNGMNIPYYMQKADLIVGIEANPELCKFMELKFSKNTDQVAIENYVIGKKGELFTTFYIHNEKDFLSSVDPVKKIDGYVEFKLPSKTCSEIIEKHLGDNFLYFTKFDLEGSDVIAIKDMFENSHYPEIISAELHNAEVPQLIFDAGRYNSFKLVDGATVGKKYKKTKIATTNGKTSFKFISHSAGPFGDDIAGPYFTENEIKKIIAETKSGWVDICAAYK